MNLDQNSTIWDAYFALQTVGDLRKFQMVMDLSDPEQAAFSYYISTWPFFKDAYSDAAFAPGNSLSNDRSSIFYGNAPVIFEGSNQWSIKPYLPIVQLEEKLSKFENLVKSIRNDNRKSRMVLIFVPEKDYIISHHILGENRFDVLREAVVSFAERMSALDVPFIFDALFEGSGVQRQVGDYSYQDTHLMGKDYISIFESALTLLGYGSAAQNAQIDLADVRCFGDLAAKFESGGKTVETLPQPDVSGSEVAQVAGLETFGKPLGKTWQTFVNNHAEISASACLLGDSHCSIYRQRRLTYLFANFFQNVHFSWNPCGARDKTGQLDYDTIVLEASSRFTL